MAQVEVDEVFRLYCLTQSISVLIARRQMAWLSQRGAGVEISYRA